MFVTFGPLPRCRFWKRVRVQAQLATLPNTRVWVECARAFSWSQQVRRILGSAPTSVRNVVGMSGRASGGASIRPLLAHSQYLERGLDESARMRPTALGDPCVARLFLDKCSAGLASLPELKNSSHLPDPLSALRSFGLHQERLFSFPFFHNHHLHPVRARTIDTPPSFNELFKAQSTFSAAPYP